MTYRFRRIKCDEGKPYCARCINTSRTCEGYTDITSKRPGGQCMTPNRHVEIQPAPPGYLQLCPSNKFDREILIPPRLLDSPGVTPQQLRALQFFQYKSTEMLSGWVSEQFWKIQLPQVCHAEPA